MKGTSSSIKTPRYVIIKATIYLALLLGVMLLLVGTSMWLYNQQAEKSDFLYQQQIPFIKNNAQLMKSVAELENQLVAQRLAISHQQLEQPLDDVKKAWLEIVDLSKQHVDMVDDNLRDNYANDIALTAQKFANEYKSFVLLVDDLILIRQSRNGQYKANTETLTEIIADVNLLRRNKQSQLNKHSYQFVNRNNKVKTDAINSMVNSMNEAQFYQYIYQELLKLQNQLTALSSTVTPYQFNQISTQIANLAKNINKQLLEKSTDKELQELTANIEEITNQLMGSGQLFAKWRDENTTSEKVIAQLSSYQLFLSDTATLIEKPDFYDLPEFILSIPILNIKVKESMMLPVAFLFIVILLSSSAFIAWRLMVLVMRSYHAGIESVMIENEREFKAEKVIARSKAKAQEQLDNIMQTKNSNSLKAEEQKTIADLSEQQAQDEQPSFYQINNLIMDLEKFNKYHGSAEMAVFMLEDYMERNKQNFDKLKQALAVENIARVSDLNAAILKTANILSAPRLINVCEQLKQGCEEKNLHKIVPLIVEMNSAISEVAGFVEET